MYDWLLRLKKVQNVDAGGAGGAEGETTGDETVGPSPSGLDEITKSVEGLVGLQ